ncbi:MAG: response regulator [Gammaproteobacteria bacterium]|nr:response regulator [Gammaproteobacteria bacterium]MDH5801800.1 response regulator [Gammaproteobacteria bacterium]
MREQIRNSNILVIDDEPVNVAILEEVFSMSDMNNVTGTINSVEGVELYRSNNYDIVLLDINMPNYDGFDVMEKFREIGKDQTPPVLILTAANDEQIKIRALQGGAADFLLKPFNNEEILCRVNNLLELYLSKKELAWMNRSLEDKIIARTQELAQSQQEALLSLGFAAEYRDMDTASHTVRVGWYSKLLGRGIGFGEREQDILQQAAPMHDVGKLGIPDNILLKPGKLTAEEWEIMKTHCEIGAKILGVHSSPLMCTAKEIALGHHEKYDGSGYPSGLVGENIPINARIVILADVFDALTIERPYKNAWPLQKAIDYINSESGSFFDPELVKVFNDSLDDVLKVMNQFKD